MKEILKRIFNWKSLMALILFILCLVLLLMEGCSGEKAKRYQKAEGFVFGTVYHITYSAEEPMDSVIKEAMERVDNALSLFNEESTLSRLNNGDTVEVDSLYINVYERGLEVSRATEGCFDMTVAPLVNLYGFGTEGRVQDTCGLAARADSILESVGYEKCRLVVENGRMWMEGGVKMDAAAIAKGFGCDVVAWALEENGCRNYCVEIGGEVRVGGVSPRGDSWKIGINKPEEDSTCVKSEIERVMELTDCGMATSGNYRNFYEVDSMKIGHTVDPRNGRLAKSGMLSATVIAGDCMTADAWATACMVVGVEKAVEWMEGNKEMSAFFIYEEEGEMKSVMVTKGKVESEK